MQLSEREKQILDDIERRLYEQDPNFARDPQPGSVVAAKRKIRLGVATFLAGFAILIAFFIRPAVPVGAVAFLMMLGGAFAGYQGLKTATSAHSMADRFKAPLASMVERYAERVRDVRRRGEDEE